MKFGKINVFKIAALILALVMCLSAVACGGDIATETEGKGGDDAVETEANEKPRFEGEALSVGDTVTMGAYFDETDDEMSALKWEVIKVEKDRALVITEKAIDQLPFEKTAYKAGTIINWESSSLREYLNGEFYDIVFTNKEKAKILNGDAEDAIAIVTKSNIRTDLGACEDTYDKVFLLSADEAEEIFADNTARQSKSTVYTIDSGARVEGGNVAWWLRTMGETYDRAAVVSHDGSINYTGYNVNFGSAAVRPCMWIATNTDYKDTNPVVSFAEATVGSRVEFGTFEQDGDTANGKEALVWNVLAEENGKLLLMTENVIDMQKFSKLRVDSWETSILREWANGAFLTESFTGDEQAKIADTTVAVSVNPETGAKSGKETTDKVFVLSIDEVTKYLPDAAARQAEPTEVAIANGVSVDPIYGTSGYWTRDMGTNGQSATYVYYYGGINYEGVHIRNTEYIGVRPVIWVTK
jgi:hypothetical protein